MSCRKAIFSYNFTDQTKLTILFHLQTLGAGRTIPSFMIFWKIKFCQKIAFLGYFLIVLRVFTQKRSKTQQLLMILSIQFNFLENDVCFSLLGQKLCEKLHFLWPKCHFQGEGKSHQNITNWNYVSNININNNKTTDM